MKGPDLMDLAAKGVVRAFYGLLRLLGWPERKSGAGDDGSPE